MKRCLAPLVALLVAACGDGPGGDGDNDSGPRRVRLDGGAPDSGGQDARPGLPDTGPRDSGPIPDADFVPGRVDLILLSGTVVTPDETYEGEVLVEGSVIACARPGTECSSGPKASGATRIRTHGVISPGLIDTHNHILFDIFDGDDWLPARTYTNHNSWPNEARYGAMLDVKQCLEDAAQGKPSWCPAHLDGEGDLKCEMDKWGELKGLIAGTTSIVGLPGTSSGCFSSLSRSVDTTHSGLGGDFIQTTSTFPPSRSTADGVCANFADGDTRAYLVHVGEGTDSSALAEWARLGAASTTPGCLYASQTTITHGTVFGTSEFSAMGTAGMKLTWSPASNVALYGETTDIPAALSAGVVVSLAPDWSMGGSQNLLDELRFANGWDDSVWGDQLSADDLVRMVTTNAALAISYDAQLGRIAEGYRADLAVFLGDPTRPYETIVAATPREVTLVLVDGVVLYGDSSLEGAAPPSPGCDQLDVCGASKFVCTAKTDSSNKLDQRLDEIQAALESALVELDGLTPSDGFNFAPLTPLVKCP
ncbi:MAG: amidohydrolase family protein [Deltaproteobacteria bacterium]|nr:amidohydrolase family protein [Deltaproteobacteria bacterium]